MKLTQELIDQIQEAMLHTKKDGTVNWKDTDEVVVQLAGTFAADRFIVIKNRTKDPVISAAPHPRYDYERRSLSKMKIPNWQHHSKKERKRHLKPQALRAARKRLQALKKRLGVWRNR